MKKTQIISEFSPKLPDGHDPNLRAGIAPIKYAKEVTDSQKQRAEKEAAEKARSTCGRGVEDDEGDGMLEKLAQMVASKQTAYDALAPEAIAALRQAAAGGAAGPLGSAAGAAGPSGSAAGAAGPSGSAAGAAGPTSGAAGAPGRGRGRRGRPPGPGRGRGRGRGVSATAGSAAAAAAAAATTGQAARGSGGVSRKRLRDGSDEESEESAESSEPESDQDPGSTDAESEDVEGSQVSDDSDDDMPIHQLAALVRDGHMSA
ncbi:hypothetical protein CHLRE_04g214209v5 [Chlamydomonas reinhardtii]|uniref:Uncharacterized protein n=1 Tax=Chlamydomonas reinhardtii TaxID=3055 RepID=A0A2K3DT92_CHLRE|nr:uncharacterized protein CHLRE_04g214209v5 [Chlamydomonas reinhardtii]PNW83752.1 hypothetical protein CHLRE_04g214209v5 [Chlamydomonas reinhardtii]